MGKIVLNIPHSSHRGVLDYGWMPDVLPFVERWTDWHTDWLFKSEDKRVKPVVFQLSRFV